MCARSRRPRLRAATVRLAGRVVRFAQVIPETFYDGLVPPFLGYAGLRHAINDDYGDDNSCAREAHIKSGLYSWEKQVLEENLRKGMRVMVLAAGAGREALALLEKGMEVDAWECSDALREAGNRFFRQESIDLRIQPVEPSQAPAVPAGQVYDMCIVGWSAYCHILRQEDRIALLASLRRFVTGSVLISFIDKSSPRRLKKALRRIAALLPGTEKNMPLELVAQTGWVAVGFSEDDIRREAAAAGFAVRMYRSHPPEYPCALLVPDGDGK